MRPPETLKADEVQILRHLRLLTDVDKSVVNSHARWIIEETLNSGPRCPQTGETLGSVQAFETGPFLERTRLNLDVAILTGSYSPLRRFSVVAVIAV